MTIREKDILEVFEFWKETMNKAPRTSLTKERKAKIVARLNDGFTVEDLKRIILVVSTDPWWRGSNQRNKAYDDVVNIFRNATRAEEFLNKSANARLDLNLSATPDTPDHDNGFCF